jgi:hypothetical protein
MSSTSSRNPSPATAPSTHSGPVTTLIVSNATPIMLVSPASTPRSCSYPVLRRPSAPFARPRTALGSCHHSSRTQPLLQNCVRTVSRPDRALQRTLHLARAAARSATCVRRHSTHKAQHAALTGGDVWTELSGRVLAADEQRGASSFEAVLQISPDVFDIFTANTTQREG